MTTRDLHEYIIILRKQFGFSLTEIAEIAGVERTNLSKWINHPDSTYISRERLERLEHTVMYIAYGISTLAHQPIKVIATN